MSLGPDCQILADIETIKDLRPEVRNVVVGDGDFLNESLLGRIPGNIELGLNMVDWLVQESDLLSIRAKKIEPRALREVSEEVRPWIKYANMLLPALVVVLFGLFRWRSRRNREFIFVRSREGRPS